MEHAGNVVVKGDTRKAWEEAEVEEPETVRTGG
jgi:hypothetical protein